MISKKLQRAKAATRRKVKKFRKLVESMPEENLKFLDWCDTSDRHYGCPYCKEYVKNSLYVSRCQDCPLKDIEDEEDEYEFKMGPCSIAIDMPTLTREEWNKFLDFVWEENRKSREK